MNITPGVEFLKLSLNNVPETCVWFTIGTVGIFNEIRLCFILFKTLPNNHHDRLRLSFLTFAMRCCKPGNPGRSWITQYTRMRHLCRSADTGENRIRENDICSSDESWNSNLLKHLTPGEQAGAHIVSLSRSWTPGPMASFVLHSDWAWLPRTPLRRSARLRN